MLRIVFMGSDGIALPLLDWLVGQAADQIQIVGVFTQPDRPVGRGQKIQANAIKTWALTKSLPVFQPEKITEDVRLQLAALTPDVSLVMAYGHILRDDFISTPRLGTLNLHASILPSYRGASPIQSAVACGESETGVSLMRIVRKLDAGPVADVERVSISESDTALEIEAKLSAACVPLVSRNLAALAEGRLQFHVQDEVRATFCRRLVKEDGKVDFAHSARLVAARINGLFPWPACAVEITGQSIKLGLATSTTTQHPEAATGQVIKSDEDGLHIAAGDGTVVLRRLQRPGGKMLSATEFLRGFPVPEGTIIHSQPQRALVAAQPFR